MSAKSCRRIALWTLLKDGEGFSQTDLCTRLDATISEVRGLVGELRTKGFLQDTEFSRTNLRQIILTEAGKRAIVSALQRDQTPLSRERNMWRTARVLRTFSPTDIQAHATTPELPVTISQARAYCKLLDRGDYLRLVSAAKRGAEPQFRLKRDTGPNPPESRRLTGVFDPNLETFVQISGVDLP